VSSICAAKLAKQIKLLEKSVFTSVVFLTYMKIECVYQSFFILSLSCYLEVFLLFWVLFLIIFLAQCNFTFIRAMSSWFNLPAIQFYAHCSWNLWHLLFI